MNKPKPTISRKGTKPPPSPKKTIKNIKKGKKEKSFSEKYIEEREKVFKKAEITACIEITSK